MITLRKRPRKLFRPHFWHLRSVRSPNLEYLGQHGIQNYQEKDIVRSKLGPEAKTLLIGQDLSE